MDGDDIHELNTRERLIDITVVVRAGSPVGETLLRLQYSSDKSGACLAFSNHLLPTN